MSLFENPPPDRQDGNDCFYPLVFLAPGVSSGRSLLLNRSGTSIFKNYDEVCPDIVFYDHLVSVEYLYSRAPRA